MQRIHQQPAVVLRPLTKAWTALRNTLIQRQAGLAVLQSQSNLIPRHPDKTAALAQKFLRVIQVISRPVAGVNPFHVQRLDQLDGRQVSEYGKVCRWQ